MNSRQNTEFFGKIVFYVGYFDYFREFQSLPFRVLPLRDLDTIDRLNKDSLLEYTVYNTVYTHGYASSFMP